MGSKNDDKSVPTASPAATGVSTTGISRKDFLKGSAFAMLGVASTGTLAEAQGRPESNTVPVESCRHEGWSWETKPVPIPAAEIKNTITADVVVIGAGLSGFVAALSAKERSADVAIIDKNATYAARGGHITAFNSKVHARLGIKNDYRQTLRDWIAWAQGKVKEELLWEFGHKSGACMDWLIDQVEPRGLKVTLWGGYYKGPDYTENPVTHFFYKEASEFDYKNGIATGTGNPVLMKTLEQIVKERGIRLDYKTKAVQLVRDGSGPVTAVIAGQKGNYTKYVARKSIIIATGCYASNEEMKRRYSPYSLAVDSQIYFPNKCNTGDGHVMAMQIGGAMQRQEPHGAAVHLESGAASYGFLHVNALGQRWKNEDVNTQSKSVTKALQPKGIAWSIYDRHGLDQVKQQVDAGIAGGLFYGQMFQRMGAPFDIEMERRLLEQDIKVGKVVTADSIEELARKMNVPVDKFVATVDRYNKLVANKNDIDFGKRAELLTAIVDAPFYAGRLVSTLLSMAGGLRTNVNCEVLDTEDQPVPHLYATGAAGGDFFANDYPTLCPGTNHGRCVTFGRIAGIVAAGGSVDLIPSLDI